MLTDLLDLVLPRSCVGCGRDGFALCDECGALDRQLVDAGGLRVDAATRYELGIRTGLIAYKERGRRDLVVPLGLLLAHAVGSVPTGAVLVPVPSTRAARRERGGDRVLRLARVAAHRCGTRVTTPLDLMRDVADSAGLDSVARAANLALAMGARPPTHPGLCAVVVDDITTTGATLREAVRALRAAGWQVDRAAVVAATPLRERPGPTRAERVAAQQVQHIHTGDTPGMPGRGGLTSSGPARP